MALLVFPAADLLLLLLFPLLFLSASSAFPFTAPDAFLHCFQERTCSSKSTTEQLVLFPDTSSYETTFQSNIQNLRLLFPPSKKPTLIVTPMDDSHVQAAVTCSRLNSFRVRILSGGHDYEGLSYISVSADPFVLIDLSKLRAVSIDTKANTAWVSAGAILGELYYRIAERSLGFPAGLCPTIGVGGHFSGGGAGTMTRKFGLAADNMVDAKMVDADGRLLDRQSMGEDLFWAIRGGGASSFGVVLAYKINLVPVPPEVTVFNVTRSLTQNAASLLSRWEEIGSKFDKDLFIRAFVVTVDDAGGRTINVIFQALFLGAGGSKEAIAYMNKSFPELRVEVKDLTEMTWLESVMYFSWLSANTTEVLLDRRHQSNLSFKAKSDFVQQPIGEKGWESIWKFLLEARDEQVLMILDPWGGMLDEVQEGATPFPHRKGNLYNIQYVMTWAETEEAVTKKHLGWMRKLYEFMGPFVSKNPRAAYLLYRDLDLGRNMEGGGSYLSASLWGRLYFKDNFERLASVKGVVDSTDFFRHEQSIPPFSG